MTEAEIVKFIEKAVKAAYKDGFDDAVHSCTANVAFAMNADEAWAISLTKSVFDKKVD